MRLFNTSRTAHQAMIQQIQPKAFLKTCGILTATALLFMQSTAYANNGGRFSQVSFNDMIAQTIKIGHGNDDASQFNTLTQRMSRLNGGLHTTEILLTQNQPVVNTNNNFQSADFSNIQTAKSSLAVMHTLSEICPKLLHRSQRSEFNRGFDNKLKAMLPTVTNPKSAMRYLSTQQDYRRMLSNMRAWQMKISDAENLAVCEDILSYR